LCSVPRRIDLVGREFFFSGLVVCGLIFYFWLRSVCVFFRVFRCVIFVLVCFFIVFCLVLPVISKNLVFGLCLFSLMSYAICTVLVSKFLVVSCVKCVVCRSGSDRSRPYMTSSANRTVLCCPCRGVADCCFCFSGPPPPPHIRPLNSNMLGEGTEKKGCGF